jgi:hypothetical protein
MQTLMDSPSNIGVSKIIIIIIMLIFKILFIQNLSQSSRFTRFCLQQICTYLSCYLSCLVILVNFYMALWYTAPRQLSWEIVFTAIMGVASLYYVILDFTSRF